MTHSDTFVGSSLLAGKTMSLLDDQRIRKIPQNYTIWYEYLNGDNPDLNNSVNDLLKKTGKFTDGVSKEIYAKFFSHEKENETIRQTSKLVQQSIDGLRGNIDGATDGFSCYEDQLSRFAANANKLGGRELADSVSDMLAATSKISTDANVLKASLDLAGMKISELQTKLEAVEKESLTDELTGISNRKFFNSHILSLSQATMEKDIPYCLIMADIDHFKKFNDDHGHQFGDEVLKFVAKTLESCLPEGGVVARYGGEEFAVLLPDIKLENVNAVCEQMRKKICSKTLMKRQSGEEVGNITMSFGIAISRQGDDADKLIERADSALYLAKNEGRNRIKLSAAPLAAAG